MKKSLYVWVKMFSKTIVAECHDGCQVKTYEVKNEELCDKIFELLNTVDTNTITMKGPRVYLDKYVREIQARELQKYNSNKIEFKFI